MKAEEQIIMATIKCIEKLGISKTTIREIGKEAGMNSASINYYFRNKENLIQKVMDITLDNAFDMSDLDFPENMTPKEKLSQVLLFLFEGGMQYPNLTRAHFSELFHDNNYHSTVVVKCNDFVSQLVKTLFPVCDEANGYELHLSIINMISSVLFIGGLFPNFFCSFPSIDFNDSNARKAYIQHMVDKMF